MYSIAISIYTLFMVSKLQVFDAKPKQITGWEDGITLINKKGQC